jgi:hypothetical protein
LARLVMVLRLRRRLRGGLPIAARRAFWVARAVKASAILRLRAAVVAARNKVMAVRPLRRHQPRSMLLLAGSLRVE